MRVAVAGGHGQVALLLERRLAESGHEAVALIRNPAHEGDVRATGATPVVLDLESHGRHLGLRQRQRRTARSKLEEPIHGAALAERSALRQRTSQWHSSLASNLPVTTVLQRW